VEPVVAKHDVRLAVENHKDYRASDLADLFRRLGSRHVGACLDAGNNIALLGVCPRINRCFPIALFCSRLGSPAGSPVALAGAQTPLGAHR
jgi:hypothetical protein